MNRDQHRQMILWQLQQRPLEEVHHDFNVASELKQHPFMEINPDLLGQLRLAHTLIKEECGKELLPALEQYMMSPSLEKLVEVFDGAIDTVYVVLQLCYSLDLPFNQGFAEVHASNMDKLQRDENGKLLRREDGKILKPQGWQPPNLFNILLTHANLRAQQQGTYGADNWKALVDEIGVDKASGPDMNSHVTVDPLAEAKKLYGG